MDWHQLPGFDALILPVKNARDTTGF